MRAGKVRYIGASNLFAWELCEAHFAAEKYGLAKFISAQDHYNLLYRDIEKRFEPFCVKYGIGMTHYFPLAGGMLAGAYKRGELTPGTRQANNPNTAAWQSARNWDVQEKLLAFAQERGWTLAQMSLAWLLSRPATFTVIAGADKPQHLRDNVKALEIRFTPEDLTRDRPHHAGRRRPHRGAGVPHLAAREGARVRAHAIGSRRRAEPGRALMTHDDFGGSTSNADHRQGGSRHLQRSPCSIRWATRPR